MSSTNLSPPIKGSGQWTTNTVEGSLWGVEAEIQELEQKIEVAKGKIQAHYQEWLGGLCHAWEALQEELVGLREEGTARAPPPLTSLQATPRSEDLAPLAGHATPRVLRSPSPKEMPLAVSDAENMEEGVTKLWPHKGVLEAQVRLKVPQGPTGQGGPEGMITSPEEKGPRKGDKTEGISKPMPDHARAKVTLMQSQAYTQHQSHLWPHQFQPGTVALREICRY